MAINSRSLANVQTDVTNANASEGDFRSGMDDVLIQVDGNQIKLARVTDADLDKLNDITVSAAEFNVIDGLGVTSSDLRAAKGLEGAGSAAAGRFLSFTTAGSDSVDPIYTWAVPATQGWHLVDGDAADPSDLLVDNNKYVRFLEGDESQTGAININFTDTSSGSSTDPYDIAFDIKANGITAEDLNVTGNGTATQFLRSDGDGSFTWALPTNTDTTYTASTGLTLTGTAFSISTSGVNTNQLAASAVETAKINNSAVTTDKLNNSAVTTAKIADSNVTAGKLASNAVTTVKINNDAVTSAKLATNSVIADALSQGAVVTIRAETGSPPSVANFNNAVFVAEY